MKLKHFFRQSADDELSIFSAKVAARINKK